VTARDHGCCYICGREADEDETFELDHIRPVAEGGAATDMENLGLACAACHEVKSKAEARRGNARKLARRRRPPRG
jgi:5-methylcytosine-specific restriction protein A